tara:strand:- start:120 stop:950 length:831 start_codon:yes stop_codon:yes gene_type:complete
MTLKDKIKQAAFKNHIWIEKLNSKAELESFLTQFREHYISCDLVRIGGNGDGGYLLPDVLDKVSYCFSPGVDFIANFEKELSEKFNIKSFMADASVKKAPLLDKNFDFIPKFLGSRSCSNFITLHDWIKLKELEKVSNLLLQMDIEGGEYDVLIYEDSDILSLFSVMIIEFHNLQKLFEDDFLLMVTAIYEKLYKNFSICHVHPNNCCGVASLDGIEIPRVIEVTFLRNDLVDNFSNENPLRLPHPLDSKNVFEKDDIFMPMQWWQKSEIFSHKSE